MSTMLVDEEFVAVQPSLVRALGGKVVDALVLQYLHFWLRVSSNEHDGEVWVYNTYQDWSDRLGITAEQARRSMERLERDGLVLSCQPNSGTYDHKKWYRIDYGHACLIDLADSPDRSGGSARSSSSTERTNREAQPLPYPDHDDVPGEDDLSEEGSTQGTAPVSAKLKKPSPDDNPSPEVVHLCELLADLYHANGNTRPNPHQRAWYREARLLLTKDGPDGTGYAVDKVENVMRWGLAHHFWKTNLRSMPKFRYQFDTVRGQALEEHRGKKTGPRAAPTLSEKIAAYKAEREAS